MARWSATVAVVVSLAAACSDAGQPPLGPGDSSVSADSGLSFLAACQHSDECASNRCVQLGTQKRCTRDCKPTSPCPSLSGWMCNTQSYCECAFTGKQPTVCNVDGDCDGKADKIPVAESCNDEDDDCNGKVDDVSATSKGAVRYYRDSDGDGYGDFNVTSYKCQTEQGWVLTSDDCDDTRKLDHPGATEICGDAHDNDCDGGDEDTDVCGLTPISVPDVTGNYASATMKSCGTSALLDESIDLTEILAKQDKTYIKFTLRLAGVPAVSLPAKCSSYMIRLGDPGKDYDLIYIYRPNVTACGTALPARLAYLKGQPMATTVVTAFNAADPGHVSFIIDKTELLAQMPTPTYKLEACANSTADAAKDLTSCEDACTVPIHR